MNVLVPLKFPASHLQFRSIYLLFIHVVFAYVCVSVSIYLWVCVYKQRLNALAALVRGNLPSLHRNIITALITIDVHARDIVTELVKEKVCVFVLPCHRNGENMACLHYISSSQHSSSA